MSTDLQRAQLQESPSHSVHRSLIDVRFPMHTQATSLGFPQVGFFGAAIFLGDFDSAYIWHCLRSIQIDLTRCSAITCAAAHRGGLISHLA